MCIIMFQLFKLVKKLYNLLFVYLFHLFASPKKVEPKSLGLYEFYLKITLHFAVFTQTHKRLLLIFILKIRRLSSNKGLTTLHFAYFLPKIHLWPFLWFNKYFKNLDFYLNSVVHSLHLYTFLL